MAGSQPPILINPIPPLLLNEGSTFEPLDLKQFISYEGELHFFASLVDGKSLPAGLDCSDEGVLSGTPQTGTLGEYQITLTVENDSETPLIVWVKLSIQSALTRKEEAGFIPDLQARIEGVVTSPLQLFEKESLFAKPLTPAEIYHLLQQFAYLIIWDVYNLEAPGEKVTLTLENANPHYHIYDRGSCLVAAPKDLFSHQRTVADMLQAARVMAREAYKRGWTIEFAGFNKMVRAAWVELQKLGHQHNKKIDILHYDPPAEDFKIFEAEIKRPLSPSV